jgi:hypothetical protein
MEVLSGPQNGCSNMDTGLDLYTMNLEHGPANAWTRCCGEHGPMSTAVGQSPAEDMRVHCLHLNMQQGDHLSWMSHVCLTELCFCCGSRQIALCFLLWLMVVTQMLGLNCLRLVAGQQAGRAASLQQFSITLT